MKLIFRLRWLPLCSALALVTPAQSQGFGGMFAPGKDDPEPLATALAGFAESGNTWKPMVEGLLAKGAKIDAIGRQGQTPLIRVVVSGGTSQKEKVAWLLSHGADVNIRAGNGQNALEAALGVQSGEASEIITQVLEKSDVKSRDYGGATALFAAVRRGEVGWVQQILDKGADINAQNFAGDTVLHLAAQKPGPMLQWLLKNRARTDLKNRRGDLPLHIALRSGAEPTSATPLETLYSTAPLPEEKPAPPAALPVGAFMAPLIAKSDVNSRDSLGLTPLLLAILARDREIRDLIVARKPKLDATKQFFDAVSQGNLARVKTLLAARPYLLSFRLADGTTPLHVSALWGTLGTAQLLVQKGADVGARDSRGDAPLHRALAHPDGIFLRRAKNMTAFLIGKGANINELGQKDASPLHLATRSGDFELISLLLARNPNVNLRDAAGQTPIFALMNKEADLKIVRALIEKGADLNVRPLTGSTLLSYAARTWRLELVQLLLDQGADVRQDGYRGDTALAVFMGPILGWPGSASRTRSLIPIASLLLLKGANPNAPFNSDTLLSRAIQIDATEIVSLLLNTKKVDLSTGYSNTSPLWTAVNYRRPAIVSMLLEAGADPTETNWKGETLQEAADMRTKEFGDFFRSQVAPARTEKG